MLLLFWWLTLLLSTQFLIGCFVMPCLCIVKKSLQWCCPCQNTFKSSPGIQMIFASMSSKIVTSCALYSENQWNHMCSIFCRWSSINWIDRLMMLILAKSFAILIYRPEEPEIKCFQIAIRISSKASFWYIWQNCQWASCFLVACIFCKSFSYPSTSNS